MADRILKDIRFYESQYENIDGQSMPHELGELFIPTKDTNYIGKRIARKLNELVGFPFLVHFKSRIISHYNLIPAIGRSEAKA